MEQDMEQDMKQDVKQGISWFCKQWTDRKFRIFLIVALTADIGLTAECFIFSYSIWKTGRYMILAAALFFIAWIDHQSKRIPNRILKILLAVRTILLAAEWLTYPRLGLAVLLSALLGAAIGGGMFLIAHFISKGGVGMGDVKLFMVIGLFMGSGSIMTAVFLSVMASALYSIVMLLLKKIKLKEEIPFAPFIFIGTVLTMALGM